MLNSSTCINEWSTRVFIVECDIMTDHSSLYVSFTLYESERHVICFLLVFCSQNFAQYFRSNILNFMFYSIDKLLVSTRDSLPYMSARMFTKYYVICTRYIILNIYFLFLHWNCFRACLICAGGFDGLMHWSSYTNHISKEYRTTEMWIYYLQSSSIVLPPFSCLELV